MLGIFKQENIYKKVSHLCDLDSYPTLHFFLPSETSAKAGKGYQRYGKLGPNKYLSRVCPKDETATGVVIFLCHMENLI